MDILLKFAFYITIGGILLILNIWFIHSVMSMTSGEIIIAQLRVVGKDDDGKLGLTIAQMLQMKLNQIEWDLETSQKALSDAPDEASTSTLSNESSSAVWGTPLKLLPVSMETRVLEPTNVSVTVGGVEVGGVFSWFQKAIVQNRTLEFTVSYEGEKANVVGNLKTFLQFDNKAVWLPVEHGTPDEIASSLAYLMIQRKLSEDPGNKLEKLDSTDPTEFRKLVSVLTRTAQANQKVAKGRPAKKDFAAVLPDVEDLAISVPQWYELNYLAARVAESAEDEAKALSFYRQLQQLQEKKNPDALRIDASIRKIVLERIGYLATKLEPVMAEDSLKRIAKDAAMAVDFLNHVFDASLQVPIVKITEEEWSKTAFWDGTAYHVPPEVADLPDVTYHEVAHPFIASKAPNLDFSGEAGAIVESYADIFASWIKQSKLNQTAQEADWVIAPGGVAWIRGDNIPSSKIKNPITSLKDPGTAYDDPIMGKDPQISHYSQLYVGPLDSGGVHINKGIPNKAFYETAIRIGTDEAANIWYHALPRLPKNADIPSLANITGQVAAELYGDKSDKHKAVETAWNLVGIPAGSTGPTKTAKSAPPKKADMAHPANNN